MSIHANVKISLNRDASSDTHPCFQVVTQDAAIGANCIHHRETFVAMLSTFQEVTHISAAAIAPLRCQSANFAIYFSCWPIPACMMRSRIRDPTEGHMAKKAKKAAKKTTAKKAKKKK